MHDEHQIPILFFIGAILVVYGAIITGYGVYAWVNPPEQQVKLFEYHADIWWGAFMALVGLFYTLRFNPLRDHQSITGEEE